MPCWPQGVLTIASTAFKVPVRLHYVVPSACGEGWDLVGGQIPSDCVWPQRRVDTTHSKYLVGSVDQRSQEDRGNGYPGRCHHSNKALGAGKGFPHAHKGLLWAKAKAGE